ncbi:MAG: hypothetical protein AAB150_14295 [Pseudomonadota bacterium]
MSHDIIDTAMAKRLVEAAAIRGAAIIGQPGGWSVMLRLGNAEKPLGTQRTDKPRLWRSLDRCIAYLKSDLHIARFELLDATNYTSVATGAKVRADTAERMRRTHEAAVHDKWFRRQVEQAIKEADDPNTEWVSHEDAKASWAKKRAKLVKRIEGNVR